MFLQSLLPVALATLASAMSLQEALDKENTTLSTLNELLGKQPALLRALNTTQSFTILAPSNAAFNKFLATPDGQTVAADTSAVAGLLMYHVINGMVPASAFTSTAQFLPTLMTASRFTNVTGGQVVEGVVINKQLAVFSGLKERSNVQTADIMLNNGVMHIIDSVLTIPLNPGFTAIDSNLTAFAGALTQANELVNTVDDLKDVTIFAPSNEAFRYIGSATGNLTTQQLSSILKYHVIQGSVAYSPRILRNLANTRISTVNGADVNLLAEYGKVFVNSAQVVIKDIIVANGVMHVIDNVINPANSTATPDLAAATQAVAFEGATAAANVPYTTGIIPSTTAPSASTMTAGANRRQGGVGVAALFGAGAVGMAVL